MWNKPQSSVPGTPNSTQENRVPGVPPSAPAVVRPPVAAAHGMSCLGATLTVKGEISGKEDLQVDGKVEGPVSLHNHRLTVGRAALMNSEINAREVIVYGKALGNINASDRVEIKKNGEVIGNVTSARLSIEDGSYFKGSIESKRSSTPATEQQAENTEVPAGVAS